MMDRQCKDGKKQYAGERGRLNNRPRDDIEKYIQIIKVSNWKKNSK